LDKKTGHNSDPAINGDLTEFETGSVVGLAPFENGNAILLDEIEETEAGMLTEFDEPVEFVDLDETEEPSDTPEEPVEEPEPEKPEPVEEPPTPPEEPEEIEDDELIGDESEYIEQVEDVVVGDEVGDEDEGGTFFEGDMDAEEPQIVRETVNPVIGFVCERALDISGLVDANGWMLDQPKVRLIKVPCAGMVKMSWLSDALIKGASGVFVISCPVEHCHHRTGAKILHERWDCKREPCMDESIDIRRVKLISNFTSARNEIFEKLWEFLIELGRLDAGN